MFSPARLLTLNESTLPSAALNIKQRGDVGHVCLENYVCFWELRTFSCLITVLIFSCFGLYDNENNYGCYDKLNSAFLLRKCLDRERLLLSATKSGITARTPNIFSVFLFDYNQQFHTNGLLKCSSGLTPTCTSHSDHLHYITSVYDATYCTIFFFLFSPTLFRMDRRYFFSSFSQGQRANIEPSQLASSRERIYWYFF